MQEDRDRQIQAPVMRFNEILHRSHRRDQQLRAILHKPWFAERFSVLPADGEFDAFHHSRKIARIRLNSRING